jgi:chemotaxis protein methyltransferase CheR
VRDRLVALLGSYAGLDPPAWALEARVRERAAALGVSDEEYVRRASGYSGELDRLIELLRVGETRFFRHGPQLAALGERVFPSLRGSVTAWSAGCASGEEAWTLAMLLAERGGAWQVWATDLSPAALARARQGRYPAGRVASEVPAALRARYFRRIGDDEVVNDRLRPHVRFEAHNVLAATGGREFDLVLCRNVLIYFDDARRAEAVARLVRALKPGGWLLVGYSETLRDQPELATEAHAVYRKLDAAAVPRPAVRVGSAPHPPPTAMAPSTASPRTVPSTASPRTVPSTASPRTMPPGAHAAHPASSQGAPSPRVVLRGDYVDGKRLAAELRAVVGDARAILDLDGATFLGDDAARVLRRAVEAAPGLEVRATRPAIRRWLGRHGIRVR